MLGKYFVQPEYREVLCARFLVQSSTGKCFVPVLKYKVVQRQLPRRLVRVLLATKMWVFGLLSLNASTFPAVSLVARWGPAAPFWVL